MLTAKTEPGFRQTADGLIVPESVARTREVWTRADVKAIDRATKFLKARGVKFQFACAECGPQRPMVMSRDPETGQKILRCGHADRILSGAL
jgi:hypothetical protein